MSGHAALSRKDLVRDASSTCSLPMRSEPRFLRRAWRDQAGSDVHSKEPRMAQNRRDLTPWLTGRKRRAARLPDAPQTDCLRTAPRRVSNPRSGIAIARS